MLLPGSIYKVIWTKIAHQLLAVEDIFEIISYQDPVWIWLQRMKTEVAEAVTNPEDISLKNKINIKICKSQAVQIFKKGPYKSTSLTPFPPISSRH